MHLRTAFMQVEGVRSTGQESRVKSNGHSLIKFFLIRGLHDLADYYRNRFALDPFPKFIHS